ncbi:HTH domain-containing protein [Clostridium beijerinckii]|uniref:HTH domain-containing protein n=1 Tax=Clostridium beijerinckii TaxID=1520 RepID=UPI00311A1DEC
MNIHHYQIRFIRLSEGISSINEEDRVKGIIYGLIINFGIRYVTLAMYEGIGLEEVQNSKNIGCTLN